jgi:hypothetical protein
MLFQQNEIVASAVALRLNLLRKCTLRVQEPTPQLGSVVSQQNQVVPMYQLGLIHIA